MECASDPTPSELFDVLWGALSEILGTTASATLLRRCARRVAARTPGVAGVSIEREALEYRYTVPLSWRAGGDDARAALKELVRELWPLLVELTGPVVVARLGATPVLAASGLFPAEEAR